MFNVLRAGYSRFAAEQGQRIKQMYADGGNRLIGSRTRIRARKTRQTRPDDGVLSLERFQRKCWRFRA